MKDWLRISDTSEDGVLTSLADLVEAALEAEIGEEFDAGGTTVTDEAHDGYGHAVLFLKKRAQSVSAVKVGTDPASPDETLDSGAFSFEGRRLVRIDGGEFPEGRRNVFVSYVTAAWKPLLAKMAVLEGVSFFHQRRGIEALTSRTMAEYGAETLQQVNARLSWLPGWQMAVRALRTPALGVV